MSKRDRICEGDLLGIPLRTGGFCLALVGRYQPASGEMHVFCFGPPTEDLSSSRDWVLPSREEAVCCGAASSEWVGEGRAWSRLGPVPHFRRECWLIDEFLLVETGTGRVTIVRVTDEDITDWVSERQPLPGEDLSRMPIFGDGNLASRFEEAWRSRVSDIPKIGVEGPSPSSVSGVEAVQWPGFIGPGFIGAVHGDLVLGNEEARDLIWGLRENYSQRWGLLREALTQFSGLEGYDELPLAQMAAAALVLVAAAVDPGVVARGAEIAWWTEGAPGSPPRRVVKAALDVAERLRVCATWLSWLREMEVLPTTLEELRGYEHALRPLLEST